MTRLNNQIIAISSGVAVIEYFSDHIRANEYKNTQSINGTWRLEVILVFAEY